jgi:hypothetical protein
VPLQALRAFQYHVHNNKGHYGLGDLNMANKQNKKQNKTKQNKQPSFLIRKTKEHQDNILAIEL